MAIRKYLTAFESWLARESSCEPPAPRRGPDEDRNTGPRKVDSFGQFLNLHSPGALDTSAGIDSERAPLLMSFTRHRRIPVNWLSVLESEGGPATGDDASRRRIEMQWLVESGTVHNIPEPSISKTKLSDYRVRHLDSVGLSTGKLYTESPVPSGSLLVIENRQRHSEPKTYALVPKAGKALTAGPSWSDVQEVVQVFPMDGDGAQPEQTGQIAIALQQLLIGSSVDWPIEPQALPMLSSRMGVRAFAGRWHLEWQDKLVEALIPRNVLRTAAAAAGVPSEAYWTMDESKRQAMLQSDKRSLGEILRDGKWETDLLQPLNAGGDWIMKAGNRRYLVEFKSTVTSADKAAFDLTDPAKYSEAWRNSIKGLIPIAWAADQNAAKPDWFPFGYMHTIDLSPQLITEEFWKLKAAHDVAKASEELGDAILAKFKDMVDKDPDYVRAQAEQARNLKSQKYLPESQILRLKQRAAKLGYQLATGFKYNGLADDEILVPTGPDKTTVEKVEIGRLYVSEERVATYSVMQSQYVTTWGNGPFGLLSPGNLLLGGPLGGLSALGNALGLGIFGDNFPVPGLPSGGGLLPGIPEIPGLSGLGIGPQRERREYPVQVLVRYTGKREINVDLEPWETFRQQLQAAGFTCMMAEAGDQGHVVNGDTPLREVMSRCIVDEAYRQKLAVFIPIYEQSLDRGMVKVRYLVAIRPEPGSDPIGFPSIYCAEDLAYKAEWRGIELGELLHSISLAPGEEREVTITRSFERKTEHIDSITSVLDVTKSEKLTLENSLQETLSKDQNSKNTASWNVEAKAQVGWFSGGGGGSGSHETNVRDFAESIKKSAMESTREMRVNQRQDIKSSTTTTTSINTSESTRSKFSNINQGRTLNIQFFEINNVYKAGTVVDNLRLTYVPSVELIQGTGVQDVLTFALRDLSSLLMCANNDPAFTGGSFLYDLPSLERRVLRTVVRTILREYVSVDEPRPSGGANRTQSVEGEVQPQETSGIADELLNIIRSLNLTVAQNAGSFGLSDNALSALQTACNFIDNSLMFTDIPGDSGQYLNTLDECKYYVDVLTRLYHKGVVLEPHTLTAPSSGTYADSMVGLSPSTEPYSERMREAEISLKYAEVEARHAESDARRSLASLSPSDRRSTLKAELDRQPRGTMRLESYPPFEPGEWTLMCDGRGMAVAHVATPSRTMEVAPAGDVDWPRDGGRQWALVSPDRKERIALPIY